MINKIVRILKQEQGFTLMELMIVVVILGILAGVAVPVYKGVQESTRKKVGEANAEMLNRTIRTMFALHAGEEITAGSVTVTLPSEPPTTKDGVEDIEDILLEYMDLSGVKYVQAMETPNADQNKWYEPDSSVDGGIGVTD